MNSDEFETLWSVNVNGGNATGVFTEYDITKLGDFMEPSDLDSLDNEEFLKKLVEAVESNPLERSFNSNSPRDVAEANEDLLQVIKEDQPEKEDANDDPPYSPTPPKGKRRMTRKRKASNSAIASAIDSANKKKKLYEVNKPFDDPVKEKNRQNAINAKLNRDRKKRETEALRAQMEMLRGNNEDLQKELDALKKATCKHCQRSPF